MHSCFQSIFKRRTEVQFRTCSTIFREKMAFFTRVNMMVPVLPSTPAIEDGASSECSTLKRGESLHCDDEEDVEEDDDDEGLTPCPASYLSVATDSGECGSVVRVNIDVADKQENVGSDSREIEGRECIDRNSEATQRYHYVVDRVLGVEV